MKSFIHSFLIVVLAGLLTCTASHVQADSVPEVLHYKFSGTGTSVPNLASSPPVGTSTATIMGGLTQTGTDLNVGGGGHSLVGSGVSSTTDYLNTGWAPNLGTSSWTISFISSNITASATLFYIFGDLNTASFRCFTNGVAGANNWILRGAGLTDVLLSGGATVATHRNTFVYDNTLNNVRAYRDGVLINTVAQTAPNLTGAGPFKVVGYSSNVGAPFGGLLDDFRVYNRALSAAEVLDIDTKPILTVTGNAVTIVDGDSTPDTTDHTDFGSVFIGGTLNRTFTIANSGNLDLTVGTVTISGTHAADFTVSTQPTSPVAPDNTTTFQVTFTPSDLGLRSATLSFSNNDPNKNPFDFSIQGTGLPCPYTFTPLNQVVAANGVTTQVAVTTENVCAWTAQSHVPWVTITGGTPGPGTGTVEYSVAANAGPNPRRGTLTIGGKTFVVSQRTPVPAPCTISASTPATPIAVGGGTGSVTITASTGSCQWQARSHVPWITLTAPVAGSGTGTVAYSVAANSGGPRKGRITVNGKRVTVAQD